jgi:hypothetical protein
MNYRLLGAICMIGGAAYSLMAVRSALIGNPLEDRISTLLWLIWLIGSICGILALILANATGSNILMRVLSFIPILGYAVQIPVVAYALVAGGDVTGNPAVLTGRLLSLVGLLLIAIFAIAAGRLPGWRRFAPLVLVLAFPIAIGVAWATDGAIFAIPLVLGLAYVVLGYAVQGLDERVPLAQPV